MSFACLIVLLIHCPPLFGSFVFFILMGIKQQLIIIFKLRMSARFVIQQNTQWSMLNHNIDHTLLCNIMMQRNSISTKENQNNRDIKITKKKQKT